MRVIFAALATLLVQLTAIGAAYGGTVEFSEMVESIELDIKKTIGGDPVHHSEYFLSAKFRSFYENPDSYVSDSLQFLADRRNSIVATEIVMAAMDNLSPENLLSYCRELLAFVEKGAVEEAVLSDQVTMNSQFASLKRPELVSFLKIMMESPAVSQRTKSVIANSVLSGDFAKKIESNANFLPRPPTH